MDDKDDFGGNEVSHEFDVSNKRFFHDDAVYDYGNASGDGFFNDYAIYNVS